jgi:hypothetical protein
MNTSSLRQIRFSKISKLITSGEGMSFSHWEISITGANRPLLRFKSCGELASAVGSAIVVLLDFLFEFFGEFTMLITKKK